MRPFLRQLLLRLGFLPPKSAAHPNRSSINSTPNRSATVNPKGPGTCDSTSDASDFSGGLPNDLANDLQREIRAERKFSLAEAIGRESAGFMKGESAIPRPLRATNVIKQFITAHLPAPTSALSTTLQSWATEDIRVSRYLDTPLIALTQILESTLSEPTTFCEFARQVAIAQANLTGERPHFQQPNSTPHPNAHYTHSTIKAELFALLESLNKPVENKPVESLNKQVHSLDITEP